MCAFGEVPDRRISPRQLQGYIYIMPSNIAIRARTMRVMKKQWLRVRSDPGPFDKSKMDQGHSSNEIGVSNHQPLYFFNI